MCDQLVVLPCPIVMVNTWCYIDKHWCFSCFTLRCHMVT